MSTQRLGIIMHGVTGRMGMNQHLIRSIVAIRNQGGVTLSNGDKVMPNPILIGRNAEKIEALAKANGISRFGTDLDKALANKDDTVFFDAGTTQMRPTLLAKAIQAGKHVYCEKPIATNLNEAVEIARLAEKSGVKHGAVQDSTCSEKQASLERCSVCALSLATGCLKATCSLFNDPAGTTAKKTAAALFWTWSVTGAMCWITCLVKFNRYLAWVPRTFQHVGMKLIKLMNALPTMQPMPPSN